MSAGKEHGFMTNNSGKENGGTALLGYNGKLYCLQDDLSVLRNNYGYNACGSGMPYALGSLYTSADIVPCEKRLELALRAASTHAMGVSPPFHYEFI